jgi:hypothetical protein
MNGRILSAVHRREQCDFGSGAGGADAAVRVVWTHDLPAGSRFSHFPLHLHKARPSVNNEGQSPEALAAPKDEKQMSSEFDSIGSWERVALELHTCKETQEKAWGTIDNTTLGRYLAGEVTGTELNELENAIEELPELRKLTDLVRGVLSDIEPVSFASQPQPVAAPASAPVVLPFSSTAGGRAKPVAGLGRRILTFLRQRSSLVAAACLLLAFALAMPQPGFLSAPTATSPAPHLADAVASTRPLPPAAAPLVLANADRGGRLEPPAREFTHFLGADPAPPRPLLASRTDAAAARHSSGVANVRQAVELNRQAILYNARGDLVRAVPLQHLAVQMCKAKLGPNHPTTQKTVCSLARTYQAALAYSAPYAYAGAVQSGGVSRSADVNPYLAQIPGGMHRDPRSKPLAARENAALVLREQIDERSTQDVQKAVIPVLTQALKVTPNAQERVNIVRALASLGPAAGNAVGALSERLENSSDPVEVQVVLDALGEIGPAARDAVTTLEALSDKCCDRAPRHPKVFKAAKDEPQHHRGKKAEFKGRFTPSEDTHVRRVLAWLNTGVSDKAGCFSVRVVRQANQTIRELAQKAHVEILVETVPAGQAARKDGNQDKRLRAMGARAVHVVFTQSGNTVDVHVSDTLRRQGVTAEKVQKCLQEHLRSRQYDKALEDGIKFLTAATTTTTKR